MRKKGETDMRKRLATVGLTIGLIAVGVMLFSAFESYVLNIRAHVAPALTVFPHGSWDLGNVFPEEEFSQDVKVGVSKSFQAEENVNSVDYVITCKPKDASIISLCSNFDVQVDGLTAGPFPIVGNVDRVEFKEHVYSLNWQVPDCEGANQNPQEPNGLVIECGKQGVGVAAEININVTDINRKTVKQPDAKDPKQFIFKFTAPELSCELLQGTLEQGDCFTAPYDRLDVLVPKHITIFTADPSHIHATIKNGECSPVTQSADFKSTNWGPNPNPAPGGVAMPHLDLFGFTWPTDCISAGDTVIVELALTETAWNQLTSKGIDPQEVIDVKASWFSNSD